MKDRYKERRFVLISAFIAVALIFIGKLFYIQVIDTSYKEIANKIALKQVKLYPNRGLIYDRNDSLLVFNQSIYDILVIPRQIQNVDTQLFCSLFNLSKLVFEKKLQTKETDFYYYSANEFLKQVPPEKYAIFLEYNYKFKGFIGESRTIRKYAYPGAAHILGDIGEVDSNDILASKNYYEPRDYAGKSGLEKFYDTDLRGKRGYKYILIDKFNKEQGSFKEGLNDSLPVQGKNLQTTIDIDLQLYGEKLLQNKKGSIVAIEPSTGEILAMVSSPSFDPNLLRGSDRGKNYQALVSDNNKPLFNRAIMAQIPPGSTFKPLTALIALQEGAIEPNFTYYCNRYYSIPRKTLKCSHYHPSAHNVQQGIQHSCNPYFWETFKRTLDSDKYAYTYESYSAWYNYAKKFGLGSPLGIDMYSEKGGNIPSPDYYNKLYGEKRWRAVTIISLAIGQGEITLTPLQLANMYATIANKGYYINPHIVKKVNNKNAKEYKKNETGIKKEYFDVVIEGLKLVVEHGTAKRSKIPNISFGGKTGTAQNPHGKDHSIFAGIAPIENPKIAVAVVIENGGEGGRYAAPIASLMIEKYINDSIAPRRQYIENRILKTNLLPKAKKQQLTPIP